jgi:single-strand DNA-binding protein
MNLVVVSGRLGRDPEVKYTQSGQPVANFSIAVDEHYKDRDGNAQKRTHWMNIKAWAKTGALAAKYLHKGDSATIEGRISTFEWEDKNGGGKRYGWEVVANRVEFGAKKNGSSNDNDNHDPMGPDTSSNTPPDDDIPF